MDPVDSLSSLTPAEDPNLLLPTWIIKDEYDVENGATLEGDDGATNRNALEAWIERNGTQSEATDTTVDDTGRYTTSVYTQKDSDVPILQYTVVANAPHAYFPTEAEMIWEYFSQFTRGEDGSLSYNGTVVE